MDELKELRNNIDQVDETIRKAFIERMRLVERIAIIKMNQDVPVYDASRELAVIKANLDQVQDDEMKHYYEQVLDKIMQVSKEYQKALILRSTYDQVD